MGYSEDLAIEKRPKMRCNWASKSPGYFLPVPKALYGNYPPSRHTTEPSMVDINSFPLAAIIPSNMGGTSSL